MSKPDKAAETILHLSIIPARIVLCVNDEAFEERDLPLDGIDRAAIHDTWDDMVTSAKRSEAIMVRAGNPCRLKADKRTWPKELR